MPNPKPSHIAEKSLENPHRGCCGTQRAKGGTDGWQDFRTCNRQNLRKGNKMKATAKILVVDDDTATGKCFKPQRPWRPVVISSDAADLTAMNDDTLAPSEPHEGGRALKYLVLFVAAGFISLGYTIVLPAMGIGLLAWLIGKGLTKAGWMRTTFIAP